MNRTRRRRRIVVHLVACWAAFATADVAPDTFTWTGTENNWNDAGVWSAAATERTAPGIRGDEIVLPSPGTIKLTNEVTISTATVSQSGSRIVADGMAATLVFAAADDATAAVSTAPSGRYSLGTEFFDEHLAIEVKGGLCIKSAGSGSYHSATFINGKFTGGSAESPATITIERPDNSWGNTRCFLMNRNNDFRGDIHVGGTQSTGGGGVLSFGHHNTAGDSAMLGHPDNKIVVRHGLTVLFKSGNSEVFTRRILGTGTLRGGRIDHQYANLSHDENIILGDGASIEPSNPATGSEFGNFTVRGAQLTMHENARAVLSVGTTGHDTLRLLMSSTGKAVTYSGRLVLEEVDHVGVGSAFPVVTVDGNAAGFAFSPSAAPSNYSFVTAGNASDGWTVTATKLFDENAAGPIVQNLPATMIGETNATVHADVIALVPDGEATIRVYYGEIDQADNFGLWERMGVYPSVATEPGVFSRAIDGLEVGKTYFFRHSASNSAGEFVSFGVESFATRAWTTADTFTWIATEGSWFADGVWSIDTPYQRKHPQFSGDTIVIDATGAWPNNGINQRIDLDADATITTMNILRGYNAAVRFTATNTPAVLTFAAGANATNLIASTGQLRYLCFGADGGDGLAVRLESPLEVRRTSAYDVDFVVHAVLTGGSEAAPADIIFNTMGDQYCNMFAVLHNPGNSFRGDLVLGSTGSYGSSTRLDVGSAANPSRNSMLGHSANRIVLRNRSTVRVFPAAGEAAPFGRTLVGGGTLTSTGNLHLTKDACLEPSGIVAVNAAALTADPNARFAFAVSALEGASGSIAIAATQPLTLTGHVDLTPSNADERIPLGTAWELFAIAPSASSFACKLTKPPHYLLAVTGDAEAGWTVSAVKSAAGTIVLLR
jgi:hypothetical protein